MTTAAFAEDVSALAQLARRLTGNRADADDLVQDTLERALRAEAKYAERGQRRGWLATILLNRFRDCRRNTSRHATPSAAIEYFAAPESEHAQAWQQVTDTDLSAALDTLDPMFRRVYELHAEGLSYSAIARELNISINTVGTRLMRARHRLRDLLIRD
ncbi:MAG TPA: RNA polymerase sigma factor [Kofleriaceae bacterium]